MKLSTKDKWTIALYTLSAVIGLGGKIGSMLIDNKIQELADAEESDPKIISFKKKG